MRRFFLPAAVVLSVCAAGSAIAHEQKVEGTEWGVVGEQGDKARFVSFAGSGRLFGFGGCNRFSGSYEQHSHHLTISPLAATRMACADNVMNREQEFLEVLSKVRAVQVDHTLMLLLDETGAELKELSLRNATTPENADEAQ